MFNSVQTAQAIEQTTAEDLLTVRVEADDCIGGGICNLICPEVFKMSDKKAVVNAGAIAEDNVAECKRAARDCPMDAISIEY